MTLGSEIPVGLLCPEYNFLDGDPAPHTEKGTAASHFRRLRALTLYAGSLRPYKLPPMSIVAKRSQLCVTDKAFSIRRATCLECTAI